MFSFNLLAIRKFIFHKTLLIENLLSSKIYTYDMKNMFKINLSQLILLVLSHINNNATVGK